MMKAEVYFLKLTELNRIKKLLPDFKAPLAVKVHFGEAGNVTYLPAKLIKQVVDLLVKPTLVECSVLYRSARSKAASHKQLALKHGFDFAAINILDGEEGDDFNEVAITGKHFNKCYLGKGLASYKSLLAISHFKGHGGSGFGGALKNIGMGLGSRRGKLAMHASIKHQVEPDKCISCGSCIEHCPVKAISFDKNNQAKINQRICISCSKCISVCPQEAIAIPWGSHGSQFLQERIAEYALAVARDKQSFFVNFLINIVTDCDCADWAMEKLTPDIGVLVSADPVAIDQASYDLVVKQYPGFKNYNGDYQLKHGEKLGLGLRKYYLEKI